MRCGGFVMMNLRFVVDISYCWCAVASVCLNTRLTGDERGLSECSVQCYDDNGKNEPD